MIGRRAVLLASAALVARRAFAGLPVPRGDSLSFRIMRHGSQIGTHSIAFDYDGELLRVRSAADVNVTLLSISLARYKHRGSETWRGTTLMELTGETDNNGERGWMSARRTSTGLEVVGSKAARYVAPEFGESGFVLEQADAEWADDQHGRRRAVFAESRRSQYRQGSAGFRPDDSSQSL